MAVKLARWSEGEKNPLQSTSQCDECWEETVSRTYPRWRHCLPKNHSPLVSERRTYQIHAHIHTHPHIYTYAWYINVGHRSCFCLLRRSNVAPANCSGTVPRDMNFLTVSHDCIFCSLLAFLPLLTFRYLSLFRRFLFRIGYTTETTGYIC